MPRTTLDLDGSVLKQLRHRGRRESKSMGKLASELLAVALKQDPAPETPPFEWRSQPMKPRVDLEDKEAMRRALEGN